MSFKPRRRSCLRTQNTIEVETVDGVAEKEDTVTVAIPRKRVSFSQKNEIKEFQNLSIDERVNTMFQGGTSVMDMTMQISHHNVESGNVDFGVNENVMPTVDMSMTYNNYREEKTFISDATGETSAMCMTYSLENTRVVNKRGFNATFVAKDSSNKQDMSMTRAFTECELLGKEKQLQKNKLDTNNDEESQFHRTSDMSMTMAQSRTVNRRDFNSTFVADDSFNHQDQDMSMSRFSPDSEEEQQSKFQQKQQQQLLHKEGSQSNRDHILNTTYDEDLQFHPSSDMSMTVAQPRITNRSNHNVTSGYQDSFNHQDMSITQFFPGESELQKLLHQEDRQPINNLNTTSYEELQFHPSSNMSMTMAQPRIINKRNHNTTSVAQDPFNHQDMSITQFYPGEEQLSDLQHHLHREERQPCTTVLNTSNNEELQFNPTSDMSMTMAQSRVVNKRGPEATFIAEDSFNHQDMSVSQFFPGFEFLGDDTQPEPQSLVYQDEEERQLGNNLKTSTVEQLKYHPSPDNMSLTMNNEESPLPIIQPPTANENKEYLPMDEQQVPGCDLTLSKDNKSYQYNHNYPRKPLERTVLNHPNDMSTTIFHQTEPQSPQLNETKIFQHENIEVDNNTTNCTRLYPDISMMMESIVIQNPSHSNHNYPSANKTSNDITYNNSNMPQSMNMSMTIGWDSTSSKNYQHHHNHPRKQLERTVHDHPNDMSTTIFHQAEPSPQSNKTRIFHHENIEVDNTTTNCTRLYPDISMTMDLEAVSKLAKSDKMMSCTTNTEMRDYPDMSMTVIAPNQVKTKEVPSQQQSVANNQNSTNAIVSKLLPPMNRQQREVEERDQIDERVDLKRRQTYVISQETQVTADRSKLPKPPTTQSSNKVRPPSKKTVPVPDNSAFGKFGSAKTPKRRLPSDIFISIPTEKPKSTNAAKVQEVKAEQQQQQQVLQTNDNKGAFNEVGKLKNTVSSSSVAPIVKTSKNEVVQVQGPSKTTTVSKPAVKPSTSALLINHQNSSTLNNDEKKNTVNDISTKANPGVIKSVSTNININDQICNKNQQSSDSKSVAKVMKAEQQNSLQKKDNTVVANEIKKAPKNVSSSSVAPIVNTKTRNEVLQDPSNTTTTSKLGVKPSTITELINQQEGSTASNNDNNNIVDDISTIENPETIRSANITVNDKTFQADQPSSDSTPRAIPRISSNPKDISCTALSSTPKKHLRNNGNYVKGRHTKVFEDSWASFKLPNKGQQQQQDCKNLSQLITPMPKLPKVPVETVKLPLVLPPHTIEELIEAKEKQGSQISKEDRSMMSTPEKMIFDLKTLKGLRLHKSLTAFSKYLQALDDSEFNSTLTQITGFVNPNFIQAELKIREYENILRAKDFPTDEMDPALVFSRRKLAELL